MKQFDTYRDWMLDALNGKLSPEKKSELEQAIQESLELQKIWEECQQLHGLMESQDYTYSPFFANKVIDKIQEKKQPATQKAKLSVGFRWVTLPALALALVLILLTALQEDKLDLETLTGTHEVYVENIMFENWESSY